MNSAKDPIVTARQMTGGPAIVARGPVEAAHPYLGETLERTMARSRGIGPGFNTIRLGLALMIFYAHTKFALTAGGGGAEMSDMVTSAAPAAAIAAPPGDGSLLGMVAAMKSRVYVLWVPLFFALSGFLVTGSALRLGSVRRFLWFRALRIVPALSVEVTLSAILLGAIFTTLPLSAYFTDPGFFRYFGNMVGVLDFHLPGVFESNPAAGLVNPNLWTLPSEFYCYLVLSALMGAGILGGRRTFLALLVAGTAILFTLSLVNGYGLTRSVYSTPVLILSFFTGIAFHLWRDRVPMHPVLFVAAGLAALLMCRHVELTFLMPAVLTYLVVYAGHIRFLSLPWLNGRDYSYGLYLYGFPITQAVVALSPGMGRMSLLATALPVALGFAALSWHLIEKPALRLKG